MGGQFNINSKYLANPASLARAFELGQIGGAEGFEIIALLETELQNDSWSQAPTGSSLLVLLAAYREALALGGRQNVYALGEAIGRELQNAHGLLEKIRARVGIKSPTLFGPSSEISARVTEALRKNRDRREQADLASLTTASGVRQAGRHRSKKSAPEGILPWPAVDETLAWLSRCKIDGSRTALDWLGSPEEVRRWVSEMGEYAGLLLNHLVRKIEEAGPRVLLHLEAKPVKQSLLNWAKNMQKKGPRGTMGPRPLLMAPYELVDMSMIPKPGDRQGLLAKIAELEGKKFDPKDQKGLIRNDKTFARFLFRKLLEVSRRFLETEAPDRELILLADLLFLYSDPNVSPNDLVDQLSREELIDVWHTYGRFKWTRFLISSEDTIRKDQVATFYDDVFAETPQKVILDHEAFQRDYQAIKAGKSLEDFVKERGWEGIVFLVTGQWNGAPVILSLRAFQKGISESERQFGKPESLIPFSPVESTYELQSRNEYRHGYVVALPRSLVVGVGGTVHVPHYVDPSFVVLSGPKKELLELLEKQKRSGELISFLRRTAESQFEDGDDSTLSLVEARQRVLEDMREFGKEEPFEPVVEGGPQQQRAIARLKEFAARFGIEIDVRGGPFDTKRIHYLQSLLESLPLPLLTSGYIKKLTVGEPVYGSGGSYHNGEISIYRDTLDKSRRDFLGLVIHEAGHSTAARYALDISENTVKIAGFGDPLPPDERIPLEIRQKMHEAFGRIKRANKVYTVDWNGGHASRREYISVNFHEFIAEFHLIYMVDAPGLRDHIAKLKANPKTRAAGEAYEFIYRELKERIFGF